MVDRSLIVVALGGNAISRPEQEGNVDQQFANSEVTAKALSDLVEAGHRLVITHGNGPQIGNFLLRNLAAAGVIYPLPMEVAVAHVQGGMGYMIAQTLTNELDYRKCKRTVTPIVTTIQVDPDDPSFREPTKPIGRRLNIDDVRRLKREEGWETTEVEAGVFRRVVPSPRPIEILEIETIRRSVEAGDIIVACGGGGIPVIRDPQTGLRGVRAVIDKDFASALLAREIKADAMMVLTNVDRVCINFGQPDERAIDQMTIDEAKGWLKEGQFPPGSMGPKVQSAIEFLESSTTDARVIIGPLDRATEAVAGQIGTCITKN
jgi:carbamate kinase